MAKKEGRAQRVAIILIGVLFLATTVGGIVVNIMQNNEQVQQDQQLQELLKQQQAQQQKAAPTKKAKDAYIPKGEVKKLQIIDLKTGTGATVKKDDTVTVAYRGTLASDGTIFDESKKATFGLDQVIKGWQEGIPGMKVGGKRRLVIPADMAYGDQAQNGIPANSALVFDITLRAIGGGQ